MTSILTARVLRCRFVTLRTLPRALLLLSLPAFTMAHASAATTPSALPVGTILVAHPSLFPADADHDLSYEVVNGSNKGCRVNVPVRALTRVAPSGRMDMAGATITCPASVRAKN